ncbi:Xylanase inhibitor [Theobroma cacao]|nr:Xylanase inhibitor [Theobroma cacao]
MLFLIAVSFISLEVSALPNKTLVAPIIKDPKTSLYSTTLNSRENYVIDIHAPLSWRLCQNPYFPIPCSAYNASRLADNIVMKNGQYRCTVTTVNFVSKSCALAKLSYGNVILSWTNGKNPTGNTNLNEIYFSCAPISLFKSLPQGVCGLAALSRVPLALSAQLTSPYLGLTKKFAICLPSGNKDSRVTFFGDGPCYFLPTQFDPTKFLSYTPLLKKSNSVEYYVGLKGISINGKESKFQPNAIAFNSYGNGGVKLSTVAPYTILRSDVYKIVLKDFSRATKGIPRVKNASPFGLCLKASAMEWSRVGLLAPTIELEFGNGVKWRIFEANSMKQVGGDVACLAFFNGGKTAKEAVVIGSYQMQNNFLQFDLAGSRLGFSSSLYSYRTSCAKFNFTSAV